MQKYFGILCILAIIGLFSWVLTPFASSVIWALVLYQVLTPLHRKLSGYLSRSLAAAAMVVIVTLAGVVPVTLVGGQLAYEATMAVQSIQGKNLHKISIASLQSKLDSLKLPGTIRKQADKYVIDEEALASHAAEAGQKVLQWLAVIATSIARGAGAFIFSVVAFLFIFFFVCRDGADWYVRLARVIPPQFSFETFSRRMSSGASSIFFGVAGTCLLQGTAGGIAFAVLGLPSPFLAGAVMTICALIPAVGTAMVWGPVALWLLLSGSLTKGLILVAIGAGVIGTMDNVTRPILAKMGGSELSVLTVTLGAIGGIATFGLTGIIIGPLAIEAFSWLIELLSGAGMKVAVAAEEQDLSHSSDR